MQESIVFLVRVQYHCKESSRSLSHLLMSFLLSLGGGWADTVIATFTSYINYCHGLSSYVYAAVTKQMQF